MIKLLKIEFRKILTYKVFWILFGLYFLFLGAGLLLAEFMINSMVDDMNSHLPIPLPHVAIYYFPEVWQNMAFFASIRYMLILPATIIIILITNEYTFKTVRQNIINGLSKSEFLISKLLLILLISVIMTLILALTSFMIGLFHSDQESVSRLFERFIFMPGFFITILSFLIYAFFFGFLLRSTGLTIALFTLYSFIVEPILYFFLKSPLVPENKLYTYLPVNAVIRVTEYPAIPVLKKVMGLDLQNTVTPGTMLIPLVYATVMITIIYLVMKKRDL